jgi:hypothetical protein
VQVGYQQSAGAGPVDGSLGQEVNLFARQSETNIRHRNPAASSSESNGFVLAQLRPRLHLDHLKGSSPKTLATDEHGKETDCSVNGTP